MCYTALFEGCFYDYYMRFVNNSCQLMRFWDINERFFAPACRNDVMFAHCAVGITSLPKATSSGESEITCTQGQTSFGATALSQVAVRPLLCGSLLILAPLPPGEFCRLKTRLILFSYKLPYLLRYFCGLSFIRSSFWRRNCKLLVAITAVLLILYKYFLIFSWLCARIII